MKRGIVYIVGAGPGDPGLITLKALKALEDADCIIYDHLANPAIIENYSCEKIYAGKRDSAHTLPQEDISRMMIEKARSGKVVVRLKGGDPFVFGRGGEEGEFVARAGIDFKIIPGVSSFYSVPAYAGIPLTHRNFSNAFEVITGHRRSGISAGKDVNYPDFNPDKTYIFLMGVKNFARIVDTLLNKRSFPADTPVAIITCGTMPQQRITTGVLSNIADIAENEGVEPPSIIVMGRVVSVREKLKWFDKLELFGKKIVVTRAKSQASPLREMLINKGAHVLEFPAIEIKPLEDLSALDCAIKEINDFHWIFFTSQNSVDIFFDRVNLLGLDSRILGNLRIAVIGSSTAEVLKRYGLVPDLIPSKFVAESLIEEAGMDSFKGRNILLPCSQQARYTISSELEKAGALVKRIHIYRPIKPENISENLIEDVKNAHIVTFTSSSTARNFFSIIRGCNSIFASIGPVTAKTVRELGYESEIVAEEYTIAGLVDAIAKYYRNS